MDLAIVAVYVLDVYDLYVIVKSFTEMIPYLFKLNGVGSFLSEKLLQDLLENFLDASGKLASQMRTQLYRS